MPCPLCRSRGSVTELVKPNGAKYERCLHCGLIYLLPEFHLPVEKERERYLLHQNDTEDEGYQRFVMPLVERIRDNQSSRDEGLDFGAGPGPVVANLLQKQAYRIRLYDPVFHPDASVLNATYDYVFACEVVEHLRNPHREFLALQSMLKTGGRLYLMTELTDDVVDFSQWYYHRDPTHICFYNRAALEWIQRTLGFRSLAVENRVVQLTR